MLDKIKTKYKTLFETTCGCGCRKLNKKGQMVALAIIILLIVLI
jgi:hypothetical protein